MAMIDNPRLKLAIRLVFWAALVFALTMGVLPKPPETPIDRFGDKFAHVFAFGTIAGLGALGFAPARRWQVAERLSFAGALLEVVQSIPMLHRDCDIRDWAADTLSIVAVTCFVSALQAYRSKSA
jgi:hypothetical protein